MRVITLGTSAGRPTPRRSASAVALEYEGESFLFDCGEGTQNQLSRSTLRWGNLNAIFIGHLHGDHLYGLPGLVATLGIMDRELPLKIFGPPGLKKFWRVLREIRSLWVQFPVEIIEIDAPGVVLETKDFEIKTAPLDHVIECWGYVFQEKPRPGRFDEEKATALGIPFGPLRGKLVKGQTVTLENGKTVYPQEVVGPPRKGRSAAYCSDTRPCHGGLDLAHQVDLLVHEATFDESARAEMSKWGHSTSCQAAEVARDAQAKKLVLTHISARYPDPRILLDEARTVFAETKLAWDLDEFVLNLEG